MQLRYSLYRVTIHKDDNAYKARIITRGVADMQMVVDYVVAHGATVSKPDTLSVLEAFGAALPELLKMGFHVNLPFADFQLGVRGLFIGAADEFDPRRHQVEIKVTAGPACAGRSAAAST